MLIRREEGSAEGYRRVAAAGGLEFGLLRLAPGTGFSDSAGLERAFLLLGGEAGLSWASGSARVKRDSLLEEPPTVLHLPAGQRVSLSGAGEGAELAVFRVANARPFAARLIGPGEVEQKELAPPRLGDSARRLLRSAIAEPGAPYSNLTVGEVLNRPGCWSSFPPHHHPHPEIYHYRFVPEAGFGYSEEGGQVHKVHHGDTVTLTPDTVHPQVAAPGYAMIYLWAMPHLPGNRFRDDSRQFERQHAWLAADQEASDE